MFDEISNGMLSWLIDWLIADGINMNWKIHVYNMDRNVWVTYKWMEMPCVFVIINNKMAISGMFAASIVLIIKVLKECISFFASSSINSSLV